MKFTEIQTTDDLCNDAIDLVTSGYSITAACEMLGISTTTLCNWKNKSEENKQRWEYMYDVKTALIEDALYIKATSGNFSAMKYWLDNRSKGRWTSAVNVNHGGQGDNPLVHKIERVVLDTNGKVIDV